MTDLTGLTEITTLLSADIAYTVNLPGSSKNPRKVTWANVIVLFSSLSETITGTKTFGATGDVGKLKIAGTTSGSTILDATAVAGSGTVTLPTSGTLVAQGGELGTPSGGIATNLTGLPLTTGVTGTLPVANGGTAATTASGARTNLSVDVSGTDNSTNVTLAGTLDYLTISGQIITRSAIVLTTDVTGTLPVGNGGTGVTTSTGSGNTVLSTSPTFTTPILGTPTSGTLTNCTGLSLTSGVTGTLPVANGGTGVTSSTGSGNNVLSTSPTFVTPVLGTPTSGNLTNCTGYTGTSTLVTVGTILTGVWSGTIIVSAKLDSDTAHLTTTQTFSGIKSFSALASFNAGIDVVGFNVDNIQNLIHDISASGTDIDFSEDQLQTFAMSSNTTFTTVSKAIGKSKTLKITTDGSTRTFTFPAWKFVGATPSDQAASKVGILTLTNFGTTDALIVAAYAVEE